MSFDISPDTYIDPTAVIIGDVAIKEGVSLWPYAVLRGDLNQIIVGKGSNIQEHVAVHVYEEAPTMIGEDVSVGHGAIIHGARIGDRCIIGMRAVLLNGAEIGEECIVGAGAVVTAGAKIPPRSLVLGIPAKVVKEDQRSFGEMGRKNAAEYHKLRDEFIAGKYMRYTVP